MTFGKRRGGGRRMIERVAVPLSVILSSALETWRAEFIDLSCTGAQLRGTDLPSKDEYVAIMIDGVRKFAIVAWSDGRHCGVRFEEPMLSADIARLWREGAAPVPDDWLFGASR